MLRRLLPLGPILLVALADGAGAHRLAFYLLLLAVPAAVAASLTCFGEALEGGPEEGLQALLAALALLLVVAGAAARAPYLTQGALPDLRRVRARGDPRRARRCSCSPVCPRCSPVCGARRSVGTLASACWGASDTSSSADGSSSSSPGSGSRSSARSPRSQVSKRWLEQFSIPGYPAYEANQRALKTFGTGEQPPLRRGVHRRRATSRRRRGSRPRSRPQRRRCPARASARPSRRAARPTSRATATRPSPTIYPPGNSGFNLNDRHRRRAQGAASRRRRRGSPRT